MGDLTMNFLRLMLMTAMLFTSLQGQAAQTAAAPTALPPTHEVEFLRNPDAACTDCHKDQDYGMHGKHAKATNPNNLAPVTCTNCHGQPSPQHREGVKDVMRFSDSFSGQKRVDAYPIAEQNGVCMSCHEPDALRKSLWSHDVHATKLTCTSCHQLHPAKEPMVEIPEQSRIKLCIDCHSKQHEAVKQKAVTGKVSATAGKEGS